MKFDKGNPAHVRRALEKQIKRDQLVVKTLKILERLKVWAAKPRARRVTRRKRKAAARRTSAK